MWWHLGQIHAGERRIFLLVVDALSRLCQWLQARLFPLASLRIPVPSCRERKSISTSTTTGRHPPRKTPNHPCCIRARARYHGPRSVCIKQGLLPNAKHKTPPSFVADDARNPSQHHRRRPPTRDRSLRPGPAREQLIPKQGNARKRKPRLPPSHCLLSRLSPGQPSHHHSRHLPRAPPRRRHCHHERRREGPGYLQENRA